METLFSKIVVSFLLIGAVSCACTFPQSLRNSNWTDSHKGLLQFGNDTMTGWTLMTSPLVNVWKCLNFTSDGSNIHLLVRAPQEFNYFAANGTGFLCMQMSKLTSYSFSYYLEWGEQTQLTLGYQRVTVYKSTDIKNGSISTTFANLCLESSHPSYPQFQEYHILIKTGFESLAITECPSTFFGVYWYIVKEIANSKSFCGSKNESWDVCSDYQRMTVNPQRCNQTVLYSGSGSLFCVNSITSGSYTALTLYNDDTVDGISTYRFTCLVSSIQSNGSLLVSQSPGSCNKDQTPTTQPTNVLGAVEGLNIELYPIRLCPLVVLTTVVCIFKKCRHPEKKDDHMKTPVHSPRGNKLLSMGSGHNSRNQLIPEQPKTDINQNGWTSRSSDQSLIPGKFSPLKRPTSDDLRIDFPADYVSTSKSNTPYQGILTLHDLEIPRNSKRDDLLDKELSGETQPMRVEQENITNFEGLHTKQNLNLNEDALKKLKNKTSNVLSNGNQNNIKGDYSSQHKEEVLIENLVKKKSSKGIDTHEFADPGPENRTQNGTLDETHKPNTPSKSKIRTLKTSDNQLTPVKDKTKSTEEVTYENYNIFESIKQETFIKSTPPLSENINAQTATHTMKNNELHYLFKSSRKREENVVSKTREYAESTSLEDGFNPEENSHVNRNSKILNKGTPVFKSRSVINKKNLKSKKNKRTEKSSKRSNTPKTKQAKALTPFIRSKSSVAPINKKGTFYNDDYPVLHDPESYLNLSEGNESRSGIYYDDDNENARARGFWNNSATESAFVEDNGTEIIKDSLGMLHNNASSEIESKKRTFKPDGMKHTVMPLDIQTELCSSRLSLSTDLSVRGSVSTRTLSGITGRIDSRGARYFIDNESASIAINVKASDFLDNDDYIESEMNSEKEDVDDEHHAKDEDEEDEEDEEDDDEENEEDDDEDYEEDVTKDEEYDSGYKRPGDVKTSMSVLYGKQDDNDGDPDRMVLKGYSPGLLTIRE